MYDVLSIGSATLDVFLRCNDTLLQELDGHRQFIFRAGSKTEVTESMFETGGGGTNTATTFTRQQLRTGVIAKTGNDFPSEKIIARLKEEGIDTTHLIQSPTDATDFSTIIWKPKEGSLIFVNRGRRKLEVSDIPWESLQTSWVYITSVEGNMDIVSSCEKIPSKPHIAWNPGKRELASQELVKKTAHAVTVFIVNKPEMQALLNIGTDSLEEIMKSAETLPSEYLIMTDGHRGSYIRHEGTWLHAGVFETERIEATGAGDAFGSGFVAGLIHGYSIEQCVKLASANAASVVRSPSAKQGILTKEASQEWIGKELEIVRLSQT